MPGKSEKMTNFKNSLIVFGLIVLFIGCFLLAVITPFAITLKDKVAYADSTDGVVEDNYLTTSYFAGVSSISPWTYNYTDGIVYNNDYITLVASSEQRYFVYRVPDSDFLNETITVSYQLYDQSYVSYTFTLGASYDQQAIGVFVGQWYYNCRFRLYHYNNNQFGFTLDIGANGVNVNLVWFKVEFGSSFTGYVPKDYENYGYNQGFADGVVVARDNYSVISGLTLIASIDKNQNYFDSIANTISDPLSAWSMQNNPPLGATPNYYLEYSGFKFGPQLFYTSYGASGRGYEYNLFIPASGNGIVSTYPLALNVPNGISPLIITFDALYSNVGLVVYDSFNRFTYYTLTITGNVNGVNYFEIPNLVVGNTYSFYLVPSSTSIGNSFSSNTALNINATTVLNGIGTYALYSISDSYTIGVESYNNGYNVGYNEGYGYGRNLGYDAGHRDGVLENTDYSFLGLIGAVMDAPIQAFSGLLDFNLLGVNLKSFVLAMLSLSVIIIVIKIALGGS